MASRGRIPPAVVQKVVQISSPAPVRRVVRGSSPSHMKFEVDQEGQNISTPSHYRSLTVDHVNSPGHTIFTKPGATQVSQRSVLFSATQHLRRGTPLHVKDGERRAAVILTTPRHASWLTDSDFMSGLVASLRPQPRLPSHTFHVLAAVVDGLCPSWPSREIRDGFSIQLGSLQGILPGLWDETTPATADSKNEPASLSVLLNEQALLTLPLANTLFQNGRRSTLLASEWGGGVLKTIEKRSQTIDLSRLPQMRTVAVHAPLVPITRPRMILEGLGNILAKVDIEGKASPASQELQVNIPRLLEARRLQSDVGHVPGPVGVWALVIPGYILGGLGDRSLTASPETIRRNALRHLGPAYGKLAYELSTERESMAWELSTVLGDILKKGAHFHKILSGGGEWGAKASLLSLDPQTTYSRQSEEDELEKFQRSFHGQDDVDDGAIAKPGDFVQFFVERGPAASTKTQLYPAVSFGVGDPNMRDRDNTSPVELADSRAEMSLSQVQTKHFGAMSAEGLYLQSQDLNTKLDTPWTRVEGAI